MKKFIIPLFLLFSFIAKSQDGTVDASYGTNGKDVTTLSGAVATEMQKIVVLPDGKILHAFSVYNSASGNYDFGLARYEANGGLDVTFDGDAGNGNGVVKTDFGDDDIATSLMVRTDGKIIVVGYKYVGGISSNTRVFAVARYNSNGTLDQTFDGEAGNGNGKITTTFGSDDAAYGVLESGGITVVVGYTWSGSAYEFAIARYNNNGTLDQTFDGNNNGNGKVTTSINGIIDQAFAVAVQPDAKIVVAGYSFDGANYVFALARYNINGTLDNTFDGNSGNGNGIVTTAVGSGNNDIAYDVLITPGNGKILAGGLSYNGSNNDFALVRYNTDGTLDNTFDGSGGNGNGIVTTAVSAGDDRVFDVTLQSDDKILAAGISNNGTDYDFAIARYNADGSLDMSFNSGATNPVSPGTNIIDFGDNDNGYSIASQGNNIIFGGLSGTNLATTRLLNSSNILPLTLTSFNAAKQNNSVLLSWQTSNEQNTSHFEIERSSDGKHFIKIETVQAAGNSTSLKNYSITDVKPFSSTNFYRLKIIDQNKTISYSKIIAIRFSSKNALQAFPNPVSGMLYIQTNMPAGEVKIQISDASGRTVKMFSIRSTGNSASTSVDMSNLRTGVYFVQVNNETIRIIKN